MNTLDPAALVAANSYETNFVPTLMEPCAIRLLEQIDPQPGDSVVDVAAGTGVVARLVAPKVGAAGRVVAVDSNPAMLEVGCARPAPAGAGIEWREGKAEALPLPEASFDLAYCQHGMQYFTDCAAAVSEMRRVLRPGGRAALSVWGPLEQNPAWEPMWTSIARYLGVPPKTLALAFKWDDAAEFRKVIEGAGFQSVSVSPCSLIIRQAYGPGYISNVVTSVRKLLPALDAMSDEERAAMVHAVQHEVTPALERYLRDGHLVAPAMLHIALADA